MLTELALPPIPEAEKTKALDALSTARCKLFLGKEPQMAFFANIALNLNVTILPEGNPITPTAAVGHRRDLYLTHSWWNKLTKDEQVGIVAHEIMHLVFRHHTRRSGRDPRVWNVAGDCAINEDLKSMGFTLPGQGCYPSEFGMPNGKTTEWYYDELMKNAVTIKIGNDPGGCGSVLDDNGDDEDGVSGDDAINQMVEAAKKAAEKKGNLPGSLAALVKDYGKPRFDYWDVLRPFIQSHAKDDYCWQRLNRRFVSQDIYLPGLYSEHVGELVVLVDGSGSCWDESVMKRFGSELSGVLDTNPVKVHVVYHDIPVQKVEVLEQGDTLTLTPQGGGGTSHKPAFDWVLKNAPDALCIIALTDLYTDFPEDPGIPTFWVSVAKGQKAPFGTVLEVDL